MVGYPQTLTPSPNQPSTPLAYFLTNSLSTKNKKHVCTNITLHNTAQPTVTKTNNFYNLEIRNL
jgi:hypothetical protein